MIGILVYIILIWGLVQCELPTPLNIDTFDNTIKQDLHFIEFFSPYCSHCKLLAPTWESTYEAFATDSEVLKIHMHQVNCVESGDLCDRESIRYYPLLRLYKGDGERGLLKLSYPSKYKRTQEQFIKFMKDQSSLVVTDLPNKSKLVKTKQLLEIMSGELKDPILLSFWPTSDEQLNEENFDSSEKFFIENDILELKNYWGRVSNQLQSIIQTGFVNCMSNKKICENLNIKIDLDNFRQPVLILFLPQIGANRIYYNDDSTDDKKIIKWSEKLIENYPVKEITTRELGSKMVLTRSLLRQPSSDLPVDNKVSFVYYYDELTQVPEDFDILPYLLQPIMDTPFDVAVYKTKDKTFNDYMLQQEKSLIKFINYNETEPVYEFTEELHNLNSISSTPTFFCFKDNDLISSRYVNFQPSEVRNFNKVRNWIKSNSLPFINELTPLLYDQFFPEFDDKIYTKQDLVVITMIDSTNFKDFMQLKLQMIMENYEFYHLQKLKNYEYITMKRQEKLDKVNKLKLSGKADSSTVEIELRAQIDHSKYKFNTIFTYIDINNKQNLAMIQEKGWNNDGKVIQTGDVIVVSRFDQWYWNTDHTSSPLTNYPYTLKQTLKEISWGLGVKLKLIKSPFQGNFKFMESVHRHGIFGYILLIITIWLLINLIKFLIKKRSHRKLIEQRNKGLGILGRLEKAD